jgi:hypothetical protein
MRALPVCTGDWSNGKWIRRLGNEKTGFQPDLGKGHGLPSGELSAGMARSTAVDASSRSRHPVCTLASNGSWRIALRMLEKGNTENPKEWPKIDLIH